MSKDRLTEKWLIDMLDTMLIYTCATFDVNDEESKERVRQAYTQLKEIVKERLPCNQCQKPLTRIDFHLICNNIDCKNYRLTVAYIVPVGE